MVQLLLVGVHVPSLTLDSPAATVGLDLLRAQRFMTKPFQNSHLRPLAVAFSCLRLNLTALVDALIHALHLCNACFATNFIRFPLQPCGLEGVCIAGDVLTKIPAVS